MIGATGWKEILGVAGRAWGVDTTPEHHLSFQQMWSAENHRAFTPIASNALAAESRSAGSRDRHMRAHRA